MHKARVTVTVSRDVLRQAQRQVKQGRSAKARRDDLAALLAEMERERPATPEDEEWARRLLGL